MSEEYKIPSRGMHRITCRVCRAPWFFTREELTEARKNKGFLCGVCPHWITLTNKKRAE